MQLFNKSWALVLCAMAIMLALTSSASAQVKEFDPNLAESNPGQVVSLEDQLLNGLRVVTVEQRAYVHQIVALVNQGKLPRAMVNVVYVWSLKRNPHVPFPYFQIALRAMAERRGIAIP